MSVLTNSPGRYIKRYENEIISGVKCIEETEWTSKGGALKFFFQKKPKYLYMKDIFMIKCGGNDLTKLLRNTVKANLVKLAEEAKRHSDLLAIFSLWPPDGENSLRYFLEQMLWLVVLSSTDGTKVCMQLLQMALTLYWRRI